MGLSGFIADLIQREVAQAQYATAYRTPLVGFASATDPRFRELQRIVERTRVASAPSNPARWSRQSADAMAKRSAEIE